MVDPEVASAIEAVLTDAVKILGPALIGAVVAIRVARSHLHVERLKLHDRDRALAHKRLFAFAKRMETRTFPMAEDKVRAFSRLMEEEYLDKLQLDLIYFSDRAFKILDTFEDHFTCMTRGELRDDTNWEEFIDQHVFEHARELATLARDATRDLRSR